MHWLSREVHLYIAIPILLAVAAGVWFGTKIYSVNVTYSYELMLTQNTAAATPLVYGSWSALEDQDFFTRVLQQFIDQKVNFIEANLSDMTLKVFIGGEVQKSVPILAKGREGSWWETPAGLYAIESKEKSHFSSFGKVYMPWSMPFDGNFFIHGWPYYPDGTAVASTYSGGCIRLGDDDAKAVFDLAKVGMPVLVYKRGFQPDNVRYRVTPPNIGAESFLAADIRSNFVMGEKSSNSPLPLASVTKLMTALVSVEYMNIEQEIMITPEYLVPTSVPRLASGEKVSLYNLLYLLLDESSNEAAEAIAGNIGRDRFIGLMNAKAKAIGMTQTVFLDPSGRDNGSTSTANDLFTLAKYLFENRSFILAMTRGDVDPRVYGGVAFQHVQNFNLFAGDPDFIGGKVGKDAAGESLLAILKFHENGEERDVVFILLGSPDYIADGTALRMWAESTYSTVSSTVSSLAQ